MKKVHLFLITIIFIVGILAGCGSDDNNASDENQENANSEENADANEETGEGDFPVTIEDGLGEEVTIDDEPEKIVSLMPSNTELAFALGLEDEIVGVTENDTYPEEALDKETVGDMDLNIEKIVSLEPDLVLAHPTNDPDGIEQLEDSDITVFTVNDATDFDEVYDSIDMMAEATGTEEKGDEIVSDMEDDLATIEEKAEEIEDDDVKTAYIEISPEPEIFTPGEGTFQDDILSLIHAENGAGDEEDWVEIDEEAVIEMDPDVIVLTYDHTDDPVEDVLERDGWEDIEAVKNEDIVQVDEDLVSRPGPRLVEGAEVLAEAIYPDVFSDE